LTAHTTHNSFNLLEWYRVSASHLYFCIYLSFMKMSNLGDLYRNIIFNDESCVKFLKERGLLPNLNVCTKLNATGEVCGGDMKETLKNSRKRDANDQLVKTKYMRCQTRGCQKWQSIRSQNPFFTYVD